MLQQYINQRLSMDFKIIRVFYYNHFIPSGFLAHSLNGILSIDTLIKGLLHFNISDAIWKLLAVSVFRFIAGQCYTILNYRAQKAAAITNLGVIPPNFGSLLSPICSAPTGAAGAALKYLPTNIVFLRDMLQL